MALVSSKRKKQEVLLLRSDGFENET